MRNDSIPPNPHPVKPPPNLPKPRTESLEAENARLKAEVERLTKAGDEMHRAIKVSDPILDWKIELWNAAKEGKQS